MPVKAKYSPDQRLLGVFVDGLPKDASELPKPDFEQEEESRRFRSQGSNEVGVYDYNDMVNPAVDTVFGLNGRRILVCPDCKVDVEPVVTELTSSYRLPTDKIIFSVAKSEEFRSFAECPKCGLGYFLAELVASKSFRLPMLHESTDGYCPYLSCVWLMVGDGVFDWRVLIGRAVTDVSGSATGKTWIE